jgi:PUA domain protein
LISKSETAEILNGVTKQWNIEIPKSKNLKMHQITDTVQLIEGPDGLRVLKMDDMFIPFLSNVQILEKFPHVIVDKGAVKPICNGANIMRPGIKSFADFTKGEIVCVMVESQNKFLVVGRSLVDSKEMDDIEKGEVVENLHYISDEFWEIGKTI